MRWGIHGWVVLAALWAGHAGAVEMGGAQEATAEVLDCAQARALLQQQAPVDPQHLKWLEEMCELEASQPRHDTETLAAIEQWQRDHVAAISRQVRTWLASRDPHEQVAAALLLPVLHMQQLQGRAPPTEPQWSQRQVSAAFADARSRAPDDRLVAWLEVVACPGWGAATDSGCEPEAALARLQQLDAGNAAVWLHALGSTTAESRDAEQLLAKAAASNNYEIPFDAVGRLLSAALEQVHGPLSPRVATAMGLDLGLDRAATRRDLDGTFAMGVSLALTMPALAYRACSGDAAAVTAQRRAQCIAIHTLMADEPAALFVQAMALTRLVLLTADQPEGAAWRERLRGHHWVRDNAFALMQRGVPEGYLETVWRDGELVALKGLLQAAGMPLTPPAGWLPDNDRLRSLITTGREVPKG